MSEAVAYIGMFFTAFAAATILPMQSEPVLVGLLLAGHSPWLLLAVASIGNVLGAVVNWLLGRGIERFRRRRWFPVGDAAFTRAQGWYHRYGKWSLLLSWAPIIGDPLTVVAGAMREPFALFLLLVTVAKIGRYLVLTAATLSIV
jgi:membrane protein YqaA with SNARE-associated domain